MRKVLAQLHKILLSVALSAAVLAIANIETIWQELHHAQLQEDHISLARIAKSRKSAGLHASHAVRPLQSDLSQSLEQDELKSENPFSHLSNMDPLQQIIHRGVTGFHRETYRSPQYQAEEGYDLISYEIDHDDGSKSSILAYLESPAGSSSYAVGEADQRLPFVIFIVSNGETSHTYFFRSGNLIGQSDLTVSEAQSLVSDRLSRSVPFFSVSR